MFNRLAVIISGEFRTWTRVSPYMFKFFKGRAKKIDYYFATWNITRHTGIPTPVAHGEIQQPFIDHDENLVDLAVVPFIGKRISTYYYQAYLAKIGNILKSRHEILQNIVYDQVVQTRPDIYLRRTSNSIWTPFKEFEFGGAGPAYYYNGYGQLQDVYIRSDSLTSDIIANRYLYRNPPDHYGHLNNSIQKFSPFQNHHAMFFRYLLNQRLVCVGDIIDYPEPHLAVRFDVPADLNFDLHDLEWLKNTFQGYNFHSWQSRDIDGEPTWH